MARKYAVTHETPAGTNLTILELVNPGTAARAWIYDLLVGSDATPADLAGQFDVIRGTASGTGTGVTARSLDPANPAATIAPEGGTFATQTKTANSAMLSIGLNQKATFRWVAVPGGELVVPATADNWIGLESIGHGGTPNVNACFHWEE